MVAQDPLQIRHPRNQPLIASNQQENAQYGLAQEAAKNRHETGSGALQAFWFLAACRAPRTSSGRLTGA